MGQRSTRTRSVGDLPEVILKSDDFGPRLRGKTNYMAGEVGGSKFLQLFQSPAVAPLYFVVFLQQWR